MEKKKIRDLTEDIFSGGTPDTRNQLYWNGNINWLSSGETNNTFIRDTERKITRAGVENSSTRLAKKDDIVVASAGQGHTRGQPSICLIDTYINQSVIALRCNRDLLEPFFLFYNLKSRYNELRQISDAHSSRGSLTTKLLAELDIQLPCLKTQQIIAKILSDLDFKINLNHQINQTLEQIAQAIFKSWFVDFDPVIAKFEAKEKGEDPERAAMCAISGKTEEELEQLSSEQLEQLSKTAALFPDELEESELGMIPKGWEIGIISDYGQVVTGKTPSTKVLDNFGEGIPFITPTDISDDTYIIKTDRSLTKQGQHAVRNCVIPKYSICVTCIGSQMGKAVINSTTSVTNQQINSILLHHDFHRFYVYLNLRMRRNELRLMGSSGSTMPIINKKTFSELSILRPPNIVAKQFHHCVHSLFYEVLLLLKEASILATLRDTLLPKLISGELRLENFTGNS